MLSNEKAAYLEKKIRQTPRAKVRDARHLKAILAKALAGFEKTLNALSPEKRQVALSLYLEEIREVSFTFHLAFLAMRAKSDASINPTRERLRTRLEQYGRELEETAKLYELL